MHLIISWATLPTTMAMKLYRYFLQSFPLYITEYYQSLLTALRAYYYIHGTGTHTFHYAAMFMASMTTFMIS
ncbi:MAG: hypothetical protein BGO92_01540 [Magnetospirillum sp. 64-120]|nr:MAG: hypothetical protein BGO92_01540 [Magnetospirillum sp. 64-120]